MKVELQRQTDNGRRSVLVTANDIAREPTTIRAWIEMLQIAERWLRERSKPDEVKP